MARFLWWLAEAAGFIVLNLIFAKPVAKRSAKIGENAVVGWIDDRIGEAFGITAPHPASRRMGITGYACYRGLACPALGADPVLFSGDGSNRTCRANSL